jgi:hypothetical protein
MVSIAGVVGTLLAAAGVAFFVSLCAAAVWLTRKAKAAAAIAPGLPDGEGRRLFA